MEGDQKFKICIDATMKEGTDVIEQNVEVNLNCSGQVASNVLIKFFKENSELIDLFYHAVVIVLNDDDGNEGVDAPTSPEAPVATPEALEAPAIETTQASAEN